VLQSGVFGELSALLVPRERDAGGGIDREVDALADGKGA
jgi:hypothetical protein